MSCLCYLVVVARTQSFGLYRTDMRGQASYPTTASSEEQATGEEMTAVRVTVYGDDANARPTMGNIVERAIARKLSRQVKEVRQACMTD